jgi:hypothetical protein
MNTGKVRMNAADVIQLIRLDIQIIKSHGETSVSIAKLETLLSLAESEVEGGSNLMAAEAIKSANVRWAIAIAAFISLWGFLLSWRLGGADIGPSIVVGLVVGEFYLVGMLLSIIYYKK